MFDFIRAHQLNIMISLSSICGIITLFLFISKAMPKTRRIAMILTEGGSMFLLIFDRLAYIYRGDVSTLGWWMVRISNFGVFAMAPVIIFGFNLYLSDLLAGEGGLKKIPRRMKVVNVVVILEFLMVVANLFTGFLYTFDDMNRYQRSSGAMIGFLTPLLSLIILLSVIIQYGSGISKKMRIPLVLFTTVPVLAAVVQYFAYGLSLINMTMVGTDIIMYIFVLLDMDAAKEAKEEAESENRAKTAFLANMSHEIRTPINAVLGMNEMILRECKDEEILEYSANISTAGNTLLSLINDILDFSKIGAGKMEIIPVNYDISSVLNDLVNMIKPRADEKGLVLKLDFDRTMPKILCGDEIRIKQVLTNILTNAVKYTEKGSVTFSISYEKSREEADDILLKVSVKDTGTGIKKEDMDRLFGKFERINEEHNRSVEGTGLGMSITMSLLEMMDSKLLVDSVFGQGSDFHFTLRQRVVRWEALGDYELSVRELLHNKKQYREKFTAASARILVIDDMPMNLTVFKNLLKKTKVMIDTADSGDEGLSLSFDNKYDIIFIDHMMPGKDGIETLHEMKSRDGAPNLDTPKICLTANAISGVREEYIEAGFDDYMSKPVDPDKLEDLIIKYLPAEKIIRVEKDVDGDDDIPTEFAALSESTLLDVKTGIDNNGGAEDYLSVLKIFHESLDERCDELDRLLKEEDWKNYTIRVHALKSGARIIGAADPGEEAQRIEDAGKSGDIDFIRRHHGEFIQNLRSLNESLGSFLSKMKEAEESRPLADEYILEAVFEDIKSAAIASDKKRIESIFAEMAEYRLPSEKEAMWTALQTAFISEDYRQMIRLSESGDVSSDS